jgi:hypothetical protein
MVPGPIEKRRADLMLELFDCLADGRLCCGKYLGGGRESVLTRDLNKETKCLKLH